MIIKALFVNQLKRPIEEAFICVKYFVSKIDNWSICDTLCIGLKITKKNKDFVWQFLKPYFKEDEEFMLCFGIVMLLWYYIEDDYIDQV